VFLAAEAVTRRKIPPAFARGANGIGFALLILLMLVVTFHDVVRLIG
jgi:membrane-associated protease RseP (regulator of RpoE activity)